MSPFSKVSASTSAVQTHKPLPKHLPYHKFFNRNNFKLSYYCIPTTKTTTNSTVQKHCIKVIPIINQQTQYNANAALFPDVNTICNCCDKRNGDINCLTKKTLFNKPQSLQRASQKSTYVHHQTPSKQDTPNINSHLKPLIKSITSVLLTKCFEKLQRQNNFLRLVSSLQKK